MASLLENLIDVLDKENAEYEKLIVLAEDKTPTIIKGDVESLSKITEDEQEIVGRIQSMEKQRIKVLADVAIVLRRNHHERYQALLRSCMRLLNNWLFAAQIS